MVMDCWIFFLMRKLLIRGNSSLIMVMEDSNVIRLLLYRILPSTIILTKIVRGLHVMLWTLMVTEVMMLLLQKLFTITITIRLLTKLIHIGYARVVLVCHIFIMPPLMLRMMHYPEGLLQEILMVMEDWNCLITVMI